MRFSTPGGLVDVPIQWFFADDLPFIPGGTAYGTLNYRGVNELTASGPGEVVGASRRWANGSNPDPNCCQPPKITGGAACAGQSGFWIDYAFLGEGGLLWDGHGDFAFGFTGYGGLMWDGAGIWSYGFSAAGGLMWDGAGIFGSGLPAGDGGLMWDGAGVFTPGFSAAGGLMWDGAGVFGSGFSAAGGLMWDGAGVFTPGFSAAGGLMWDGEGDWPTGDDVTGQIVMYGGAGTVPSGWLECDGSTVSQATFAALYAVLGTTWGSDAGGNFTLPAFNTKSPVGAGAQSGNTTRTIGQNGGEENHLLTTAEMPSHTHPQQSNTVVGGAVNGLAASLMTLIYASGGTTQATGGGGTHNTMHPWLCVRFIIKT